MNDVLLAAKSGSVSAINELVAATERYVRTIIAGYLGSKYAHRVDVDDVCQEVLLKCATDVARSNATDWSAYLGWAATVARHTTYNAVRHVKRKKDSADETVAMGEFQISKGSTPDDIVIAREQAERFMQIAAEMGENTRVVADMLMQGAKVAEISAVTGLTTNAVSCLAYRYRSAIATSAA